MARQAVTADFVGGVVEKRSRVSAGSGAVSCPRLATPEMPLPNWIGHRAAIVFSQRRTEWYAAAQARWGEVVQETAPS